MSIDWIPPREDWEPARKISAKEVGNRGIIPTSKSPIGILEYESCIERDFLLLAIHCPSVKRILHQPETIEYIDLKGRSKRYTPDAYLETEDGARMLVEIKPEFEVINNRKKYQERWRNADRIAAERGITFKIVTESQIRTSRWHNVWFSLGSSKCYENDAYIPKLDLIIHEDGCEYNSLCILASRTFSISLGKAAQIINYAIYHGLVVTTDFSTKQIKNSTIIRRNKEKKKSPFDSLFAYLERVGYSPSFEEPYCDTALQQESSRKLPLDLIVPDENNEEIDYLEKMVLSWLEVPRAKRTYSWSKGFYQTWGYSKSQTNRYVRRYEESGRNGLYAKNHNAGRRAKVSPPLFDALEASRKVYLKPGYTQNRAYEHLLATCREINIDPPTFAFFKRYIYQGTSKSDFALKKGCKFHKAQFTPSLRSFQGAILPLQILQIDDSPCDVFITDEDRREVLTTPNMTASIDCYTGMVTGFSISLFPSSSRSILEVLIQTILPKEEYARNYSTQNSWDINGFPVVILVDNGADYRAEVLKEFCKKYDIIIEFVPLRTPRYKAYVEKWFDVLKNAMKQEGIPGIRPSLRNRIENPDLKPENDATLTLLQIETWIHKWIIDKFHFSNHYEDHVLAPQLKLQNAMEGKTDLIFPCPRNPPEKGCKIAELTLEVLHPEQRRLTRNGVQWTYLKYNSKDLAEIYRITGDVDVKILRDKRDVRHVWVVDPNTQKPVEVGLGSGWAVTLIETFGDIPIHESFWLRCIQNVKKQSRDILTPHLFKVIQSKQQRYNLLEESRKEMKSIRKEIERAKETSRKDLRLRISPREENPESDKKELGDQGNEEDEEIDWSSIESLPTDDFPSER